MTSYISGLQCDTPLYSHCLEDDGGACSLVCDEGYAFALAPDPDVTCDPLVHDSPFPDCSGLKISWSRVFSDSYPACCYTVNDSQIKFYSEEN
jgi:hypothetical protein